MDAQIGTWRLLGEVVNGPGTRSTATAGPGFMVGCDHCDEWFHAACVGVAERDAGGGDFAFGDRHIAPDPRGHLGNAISN